MGLCHSQAGTAVGLGQDFGFDAGVSRSVGFRVYRAGGFAFLEMSCACMGMIAFSFRSDTLETRNTGSNGQTQFREGFSERHSERGQQDLICSHLVSDFKDAHRRGGVGWACAAG